MSKARVMRLVCACVYIYIYIGGNYRGIKNKIIIIIIIIKQIFFANKHIWVKKKKKPLLKLFLKTIMRISIFFRVKFSYKSTT